MGSTEGVGSGCCRPVTILGFESAELVTAEMRHFCGRRTVPIDPKPYKRASYKGTFEGKRANWRR